jgi:hypothetical protein
MYKLLMRIATAISALIARAMAPAARLVHHLPDGLRSRWFGSDVLVGSTTNYTWTANQFGHFTIGLALYALIRAILSWITFFLDYSTVSDVILSILALVLTVALYSIKETADGLLARVPNQQQFAVEDDELRLDGFADTFFVTFGAAFLLSASFGWIPWLIVTAIFGACAALLARFYLPRTDCFDFSSLPQYFRLQLYQGRVLAHPGGDEATATEVVTGVSRNESDVRVLLVAGAEGTGRSSLVIGIGVRLALAKVKLRFTDAGKVAPYFAEELAKPTDAKHMRAYNYDVWALRDVTHVIIDDAPAGNPEGFLQGLPAEVRDYLLKRVLVIVLAGSGGNPAAAVGAWQGVLSPLLGSDARIASVVTDKKLDERMRNTVPPP